MAKSIMSAAVFLLTTIPKKVVSWSKNMYLYAMVYTIIPTAAALPPVARYLKLCREINFLKGG